MLEEVSGENLESHLESTDILIFTQVAFDRLTSSGEADVENDHFAGYPYLVFPTTEKASLKVLEIKQTTNLTPMLLDY